MTRSTGPYSIDWSGPAKRALGRLPEKVAVAVIEFVHGRLAAAPRRAGHALGLELTGRHAARVGDYRIIYRIDDDRRVVGILTVEHRSDIYRRR